MKPLPHDDGRSVLFARNGPQIPEALCVMFGGLRYVQRVASMLALQEPVVLIGGPMTGKTAVSAAARGVVITTNLVLPSDSWTDQPFEGATTFYVRSEARAWWEAQADTHAVVAQMRVQFDDIAQTLRRIDEHERKQPPSAGAPEG